MSEKKQESFTVTDRRLFTSDGEVAQGSQRGRGLHFQPEAGRGAGPMPLDALAPPTGIVDSASVRPPPAEQTGTGRRLPQVGEGTGRARRTQRPLRQRNGDDLRALHGVAVHDRHAATRPDAGRGRAAADRSDRRAPDHRHSRPAGGKDQGQSHARGRKLPAELSLRTAHGLRGSDQRAGPSAAGHRHETPRNDESHADGAGQRHVDGRAHHWLRLRRLPLFRPARPPYPAFGADRVRRTELCSSTPRPIFASRRSAKISAAWTPCSTRTPTPTTFSASTICGP